MPDVRNTLGWLFLGEVLILPCCVHRFKQTAKCAVAASLMESLLDQEVELVSSNEVK